MNSDGMSGSMSGDEEDEISVSSATTTGANKTDPYPPSPWYRGTNRYASQRGMSAFGSPRNVVTKVISTRQLSTPSGCDGIVPKLVGGAESFPNQQRFQPFGDTRDVVKKTEENHEKKSEAAMGNRQTGTFLSRWATPNPNAKNADIGKPRNATLEIFGRGKRDLRCEGVLPRLQRRFAQPGTGAAFQNRRQVTTKVEGLDFSYDDESKSKAALPWATGRLGMQTQSGTGGFLKQRDVCNKTFYDKKKPMTEYKFL